MSAEASAIVWFAGVDWDGVIGTDRRIVSEIAALRPVIWIDPAQRGSWRAWLRGRGHAVTRMGTITRVRVPALPGVTRWPMRAVTAVIRSATCAWVLRGRAVHAVVVANPMTPFPRIRARRLLYLTDDWVAGAHLMGLGRAWVEGIQRGNVRQADVIAAVSPTLAETVAAEASHARIAVLPNGAPVLAASAGGERGPLAGLVGQVNERLDLALLEAVVAAGVGLRIVGPHRARDAVFTERFERLVAHPRVDWRGAVPAHEVAGHLAQIAVGLTPYTPSAFNRASSPLKTLEYLAAGVPVVSSDLPASRWLATSDVTVCSDPEGFAAAVQQSVARRGDDSADARRRRFAQDHSWARRARQMLELIDSVHASGGGNDGAR